MMVDQQANVADFVVWGYAPAEVAALAVKIGERHVASAGSWNGEAVRAEGRGGRSLQRRGDADHNDASDWHFYEPVSMGEQNANLTWLAEADRQDPPSPWGPNAVRESEDLRRQQAVDELLAVHGL